MKRFFAYILMCLGCFLMVGCDAIRGRLPGWGGEIMVVMLGYESEVEGADREFEHGEVLEGDENFIAFNDQKAYDEAAKQEDELELPRNRFEFSYEDRTMVVKTYPKLAVVDKITITSSDPSILEIVSVEDGKATVRTHKLGDVNIHVKVDGPENSIEQDYPVRVFYSVELDFYITPYWLSGALNTRIRYKVKNMPPQEKELVTEIKDSVTVVGYCRYYDVRKSRQAYFDRDTVTFRVEDKVDRFRKNHRLLVRNITSAFRYFANKKIEGSVYQWDEDLQDYVIVDKNFYFSVEQVIMDFNVVSTNPYVEFYFVSKYDKTFEHYTDDDGEFIDTGSDSAIDDGGVDNEQKLTKEEIAYFEVLLNSFMSESERQAMIDELNRELDAIGFDAELSDEEKDRQLEEINKHKKGDE